MTSVRLVLFVRGNTPRSASAIRAVKSACSGRIEQALQVVDVCQEPALAAKHRVVATPTLISMGESGERRWVGEVGEAQLRDCFSFSGVLYGQ